MNILKILVISVHVVAAVLLILLILLHSGRGGGLSDMIGGSSSSSLAGSTVVERNLDRITVVTAVAMFFTTVALVMLMRA
ncbi:MAG: preprotein translocase subunit SecG [Acidimicrobiia bacterium]